MRVRYGNYQGSEELVRLLLDLESKIKKGGGGMNKRFWFFVAGFLVFVFLLEWNAPSKFVWEPTFNHYDKQPFGCAVFDSTDGEVSPC